MSASSNAKKDLADLESQTSRIRKQFAEQMTFLDARTTGKVELLADVQEYFRRRAEIEVAYASNLDKLSERMTNKRPQTGRREPTSTYSLYQSLLAETKREARERHQLHELFAGEFCQKLDGMIRDVQQISKKVKEVVISSQDDLKKSCAKLSEDFKSYVVMCVQMADAEDKLRKTKDKTLTLVTQDSRVGVRASVRRKYEGKASKAGEMFQVARKRRCMSRNKYLLSLASSNHAMEKFFNVELVDFLEVLDYDYHDGLERLYDAYITAEGAVVEELKKSIHVVTDSKKQLNFDADKNRLIEEYCSAFSPPGHFPQLRYPDDSVEHLSLEDGASEEKGKFKILKERMEKIAADLEGEEKACQFVKETLGHKKLGYEDAVPTSSFDEDPSSPPFPDKGKTASLDRGGRFPFGGRHERSNSGNYLPESSAKSLNLFLEKFQKLKQYQFEMYHLEGQKALWDKVIDGQDMDDLTAPAPLKLFETDLEQYIEASSEPIPLIIRSCTSHLETFGVSVEGIFRVPGPQALIEELKEEFEKGEDPLSSEPQSRDIHAVASVLKEFFRKLLNSLFPVELYETVVQHGRIDSLMGRIDAIRQTVYKELSPSIIQVMRFLFHFLNRLSKFNEQTRMNSSNLAMVFGPTLTRPPLGRDPLTQAQEVVSINTIMQTCIDYWEEIFGVVKEDEQAPESEQALEGEQEEERARESPSEDEILDTSDVDSEDLLSELDTIELRAVHNYVAKSNSEISFNKGDLLHAIQLTDDGSWYDGLSGKKRGYIPAKYVEEIPLDLPSPETLPPPPPPVVVVVDDENEDEPAVAAAPAAAAAAESTPPSEEKEKKDDDAGDVATTTTTINEPETAAAAAATTDLPGGVDTTSLEAAEAELAEITQNLEGLIETHRKSLSSPPQEDELTPPLPRVPENREGTTGDDDSSFPPPPEPVHDKKELPPLPDVKETAKRRPVVPLPYSSPVATKRSSLSPTGPAPSLFEAGGSRPQTRPKPPKIPEKSPAGSRKLKGIGGGGGGASGGGSLPSTPTAGNIFDHITGAKDLATKPAEGFLRGDRPVIKAKPMTYTKSPRPLAAGSAPAPPTKPIPYRKPASGQSAAAALAQQAALAAEAHKSRLRKQNTEMDSRDVDNEEGVTHL